MLLQHRTAQLAHLVDHMTLNDVVLVVITTPNYLNTIVGLVYGYDYSLGWKRSRDQFMEATYFELGLSKYIHQCTFNANNVTR